MMDQAQVKEEELRKIYLEATKKKALKPMPKMRCPICKTPVTEEWMVRERLSLLGYMHRDKNYWCSKCGHICTRGCELEEVKPPLWYGKEGIWSKFKKQYYKAIIKKVANMWKCEFCGYSPIKIHKIHPHLFAVSTSPAHLTEHRPKEGLWLGLEGSLQNKEPLLVQLKCPHCYKVTYIIM